MVKVVPRSKRKAVKVRVQTDDTGQLINTRPIAVQSLPIVTETTGGRLDLLGDVDASGEVEGGVPRYDAQTDEYKVEKLEISDLVGPVDGGEY